MTSTLSRSQSTGQTLSDSSGPDNDPHWSWDINIDSDNPVTFRVQGSAPQLSGSIQEKELWEQFLELSLECEEQDDWRKQAREWRETGRLLDNVRIFCGRRIRSSPQSVFIIDIITSKHTVALGLVLLGQSCARRTSSCRANCIPKILVWQSVCTS